MLKKIKKIKNTQNNSIQTQPPNWLSHFFGFIGESFKNLFAFLVIHPMEGLVWFLIIFNPLTRVLAQILTPNPPASTNYLANNRGTTLRVNSTVNSASLTRDLSNVPANTTHIEAGDLISTRLMDLLNAISSDTQCGAFEFNPITSQASIVQCQQVLLSDPNRNKPIPRPIYPSWLAITQESSDPKLIGTPPLNTDPYQEAQVSLTSSKCPYPIEANQPCQTLGTFIAILKFCIHTPPLKSFNQSNIKNIFIPVGVQLPVTHPIFLATPLTSTGQNFVYQWNSTQLLPNAFVINPNTGSITLQNTLHIEGQWTLLIRAADSALDGRVVINCDEQPETLSQAVAFPVLITIPNIPIVFQTALNFSINPDASDFKIIATDLLNTTLGNPQVVIQLCNQTGNFSTPLQTLGDQLYIATIAPSSQKQTAQVGIKICHDSNQLSSQCREYPTLCQATTPECVTGELVLTQNPKTASDTGIIVRIKDQFSRTGVILSAIAIGIGVILSSIALYLCCKRKRDRITPQLTLPTTQPPITGRPQITTTPMVNHATGISDSLSEEKEVTTRPADQTNSTNSTNHPAPTEFNGSTAFSSGSTLLLGQPNPKPGHHQRNRLPPIDTTNTNNFNSVQPV